MDQELLVNEMIDSGRRLIERLGATDFRPQAAFWAKAADAPQWYLYLASPFVDTAGPRAAYSHVHDVLRSMPEVGVDPMELKVIGMRDRMAEESIALTRARRNNGPSGLSERPVTRSAGSTLGGMEIEGAYIYPSTSFDHSKEATGAAR